LEVKYYETGSLPPVPSSGMNLYGVGSGSDGSFVLEGEDSIHVLVLRTKIDLTEPPVEPPVPPVVPPRRWGWGWGWYPSSTTPEAGPECTPPMKEYIISELNKEIAFEPLSLRDGSRDITRALLAWADAHDCPICFRTETESQECMLRWGGLKNRMTKFNAVENYAAQEQDGQLLGWGWVLFLRDHFSKFVYDYTLRNDPAIVEDPSRNWRCEFPDASKVKSDVLRDSIYKTCRMWFFDGSKDISWFFTENDDRSLFYPFEPTSIWHIWTVLTKLYFGLQRDLDVEYPDGYYRLANEIWFMDGMDITVDDFDEPATRWQALEMFYRFDRIRRNEWFESFRIK